MSEVPENLKYTREHEWVRLEDDGTVTVGITDHAQQALGELVYVELPEADTELGGGDACAVVESVKAASDVYAPLAGTVSAINEALEGEPDLVNNSPYDDGWLLRLFPSDAAALDEMLDAEMYQQFLAESED
ncbi:MAG: glycine cleavage system protein GcvH [Gammaproteobacteria bacterium]|nr:glycine cleavage system protein GcvH [Gammaproteobacteria bacterium]